MKQDEKWPVFQPSPKTERKTARQSPNTFETSNGKGNTSDVLFEEMSGMVTLKRKGKESNNHGNEQAGQSSFDNHPGLQSLF